MTMVLHFAFAVLLFVDGVFGRAILILPGINGKTPSGQPAPTDPAALEAQITLAEEQLAELTEQPANSPARLRIKKLIQLAGGKFSGAAARLNPIVAELLATSPAPTTPAPTVATTPMATQPAPQNQQNGNQAIEIEQTIPLKKKKPANKKLIITKNPNLAKQLKHQLHIDVTTQSFSPPIYPQPPATVPPPQPPPWQNQWDQYSQNHWNQQPPAQNYWNQGPPPVQGPPPGPPMTPPPTPPPLTPPIGPPPAGPGMNGQPNTWGPNSPPWQQQNPWDQRPPWSQGPPPNNYGPGSQSMSGPPPDQWNQPPQDYWNQSPPGAGPGPMGPPNGPDRWSQSAQVFGQDGIRNSGPGQYPPSNPPWASSNYQGGNNYGPNMPNPSNSGPPAFPQGPPNNMGPGPSYPNNPGSNPPMNNGPYPLQNGPPMSGNIAPSGGQGGAQLSQRIPPIENPLPGPPPAVNNNGPPPDLANAPQNMPPLSGNPPSTADRMPPRNQNGPDQPQMPVIQINIGHSSAPANEPGKPPASTNQSRTPGDGPSNQNMAGSVTAATSAVQGGQASKKMPPDQPSPSPSQAPASPNAHSTTSIKVSVLTDSPSQSSNQKASGTSAPTGGNQNSGQSMSPVGPAPQTTPPVSWNNPNGAGPPPWDYRNDMPPRYPPNGPPPVGQPYPPMTTPPYSWGNNYGPGPGNQNNMGPPTDPPFHPTTQPYSWNNQYAQGPQGGPPGGPTPPPPYQATTPPYNWNNQNTYPGPPAGPNYGPTTPPYDWGNNAVGGGPTPPPGPPIGPTPPPTQPPPYAATTQPASWSNQNYANAPPTQPPYPAYTTQGQSWGAPNSPHHGPDPVYHSVHGQPADPNYPPYTTQAQPWDPHYSGSGSPQWRSRIRRQISEPLVLEENKHNSPNNTTEANHLESPVQSLEQLNTISKQNEKQVQNKPKTNKADNSASESGNLKNELSKNSLNISQKSVPKPSAV